MSGNPLLVAVDVQRLYRDFAPWALPTVGAVAHAAARLADALACPVLCTRTVFPSAHGIVDGPWRRYEERWRELADDASADPALLAPLPELANRCRTVFDKHTYSAFEDPAFERAVLGFHPDPLLITGVETDICVLATVFGAIDRNLPVWLVTDAVAGPDPRGERGTLATLARMPEQVRLLSSDDVLEALAGEAGSAS